MFSIPPGFLGNSKTLTLEYLGQYNDNSAANATRTLSGVTLGTATTDRLIVCVLTSFKSAVVTISSATINGVSATVNMSTTSAPQLYIISAVVPSGTSGNIVINFSTTQNLTMAGVYSIKNYQSTTPVITDTILNTSVAPSDTFSPGVSTAVIAHAVSYNSGSSASWSWSGDLTEQEDQSLNQLTHSSAMGLFPSGGTSLTTTATPTAGTTARKMQVISFH